jgi:Uma2 family endonuclease
MAMPAQSPEWTAADAIALPTDGNRYEVLDGELFVTPAPSWSHQMALEVLAAVVRPYVLANSLGWMMRAPADLVFSPHVLVQPDLFVVPMRPGLAPSAWTEVKSLLLAVEVLSPSTARADRHRKRLIYQRHGVPEYWIVDVDAQCIERWRPDDARPEVLAEQLVWQPRAEVAPLMLELPVLFAEIHR